MRRESATEPTTGPPADALLIDDKGRAWPERSRHLAQRLGYRHPTLDLPAFAVQERGFIHIRAQGSGAHVALRAGSFGLETLGGALYELKDRGWRRIMLATLFDSDWSYEILGSAREFAERAERLAAGGVFDSRAKRQRSGGSRRR